jgi:hypothetical protein
MQRQRKSPRFLVSSHFPLTLHIRQGHTKFHRLKTIGFSGAGFYGNTRDAKLLQAGDIEIQLSLGASKISMKARLQYCHFLPKAGVNYMGIQFDEQDPRAHLLLRTILESALQKGHLISS